MRNSHPAGAASHQALRCSNPSCSAWISMDVQHCPICGTLRQGVVLNERFRIETLLGRGGMGAVYRATDLALERLVALKVFAPSAVSASETQKELRTRFFREARLTAQLDHPHIVPVLHFDMDGALAYLVMPLLTGGTLASSLQYRRHFAPTLVLGWLRQMAAALDYAHQRRPPIIHRDVKPSNLLFHQDGRLCLADFGIARLGGAEPVETAPLTRPGVVLGSVAYMAPEQMQGHAVPASDQYSVGVVLYEALTGARPFEAADPHALMLQQFSLTPPPPSQLVDGLPPEVDAAVQRALAKDPADRFPTVGALADAFVPRAASLQPASFQRASNDPRGELPTEAATALRPRSDQGASMARAPGMASSRPSPFQPQRRWPIALYGALVLLLVGVLVLIGVTSRGETGNQNGSNTSTPARSQGTNPSTQTLQTVEGHPPLFQDALQDNSQHWELAHGGHFEADGLHLPSNPEGGGLARKTQNASAQQNHLLLPSSCAIEVDVVVTDLQVAYGFGLLLSDQAGHVLTFTASGGYAVSLLSPQSPETPDQLISGTNAGLALTPGKTAHLAVLIQGNQLAFFLNKQFITSIRLSSDAFPGAQLFSLLNLASQDQPGGEVIFENVSLYSV